MTREERMTREEALNILHNSSVYHPMYLDALNMAIEALEQEPCEDVCERFEQSIDIVTDIVEFRFSDGTVKRAKRGLYMRDIEESLRKMLIDQMANEKKQEPCEDCISRREAIKMFIYNSKGEHIPDYDCDNFPVQIAMKTVKKMLRDLPPVTPQQKMGHWIVEAGDRETGYGGCTMCSECAGEGNTEMDYCPNCGAKMEVEG